MSNESKYAIIRTGGQQFVVRAGERIRVQKLNGAAGDVIAFDEVLVVSDNGALKLGNPLVSGISVKGKIIASNKDAKVVSFKKKRRKGFTWKKGHRQERTDVLIESIG